MSTPAKTNQVATATAFREALAKVVAAFLPDAADRDDVVQETILKLMESDFALIRNVEAWMTTVAKRLAIDRLRSRQRTTESELENTAIEDQTIAARDRRQLSSCLHAHLDQLSVEDRALLQAADSEGRSRSELAQEFGLSLKGLNTRLRRARQQLRGLFSACCRPEFDESGAPVGLIPKRGGDCSC